MLAIMRVSWRLRGLLCVMVASVALAVSGCGSKSTQSSSATAALAPTTKAQGVALAQAINVQAADVPGFTGMPHTRSASDVQDSAKLASCAGGVDPSRALADVYSDDFSRGSGLQGQQVSSSVTVMATTAMVHQDFAAIQSSRGQACLKRYINQVVSRSANGQVRFTETHISTLPTSAPGSDGSFGLGLKVTAVAAGQRFPFYVDVLGFTARQAEVDLTTLSFGQPFPSADEQRLFALLDSRAVARGR